MGIRAFLWIVCIYFLAIACKEEKEFSLPYEKYVLENGLEVVLHEDKSDPIVSVAIQYHVGSAKEKPGKTGFAHFFEHMLFQRSEHLGRNAFFKKIQELGGTFNGSTAMDGTNYYETVPRDALEKVLWMESDRMGFFINTVTQAGLEREIDVVSNEKRQGENCPFGQSYALMLKYFYPEGHPYSWPVIGSIADLRSATVEDVKEFYRTYYGPNNATLVVAGDFNREKTKELIGKYFGEIPAQEKVEKVKPIPVKLEKTRKLVYEDQFTNDGIIYIKIPEPSLISLNLPVGEIIKNPENIDYFPRYAALQPDERATYLNWLKNIDETIPIGFVFIFYYGLERFLFTQEDKFEKAFNMILRLRRHHKNHSFQAYSYDTLLFACIYRQHWELFNELFKDKQFLSPLTLACMAQTGKQLFPEDILNLASAVGFKNKRYIKNEPKLFLQVLGEILHEKYASSGYPLSKISIIDCPRKSVCPVIANTSLRFMPYHVPNLLENALFKRDLLEILNSTHEKVKLLLRQQRTKK